MRKPDLFKMIGIGLTGAMMFASADGYAKEFELDALTVTAQKKAENVQEVPISMTLLDEISIEDKHIELVEEVAAYTPNLMFFTFGSDSQISPSLRGIYSDMESKTVPMAIYIDGVPILDGWAMNETLTHIERIEVLKGPQGTLYGKNSESGVMNIYTKQPADSFQGDIDLELGSDEKKKVNVYVSGPLVKDKLLVGLSASHYERDGFLTDQNTGDTIDDRQRDSIRFSLRYMAGDDLEISLINSILEHDDGSIRMSYAAQTKDDITQNFKGYNQSRIVNNALKIKYALSDTSYLESITTRRDFNLVDGDDWDFTDDPNVQFHMERDAKTVSYSQELRYTDQFFGDKLDLLTGVYLDKKDEDFDLAWSGYPIERDFNDKSIGVFTHFKYMFSKDLAFFAGARYARENKTFKDNAAGIDLDSTYSDVSPKLSVEYNFSKHKLGYATVAKGYRAGGFNHMAPRGHANLEFDKEMLWNYELGYKSMFWENRFMFNASIYYMDIQDMHVTTATGPDEEYVSNAGEAHSQGLELELSCKITDELRVFSAVGINETQFDKFEDVNGNYQGNLNPYAPKYNYNIGAQYRGKNGIYASADVNGYGKMYFDKENRYAKDAYTLVNAKLGYESGRFDIYLYAKNLFDENYDSKGYYNGVYTIYSDPREIGAQLTYRF